MRNKILSLLVLLITAASGAWAKDVTENINLTTATVNGKNVTVSANEFNAYTGAALNWNNGRLTVSTKDGSNIIQVVLNIKSNANKAGDVTSSVGTCTVDGSKITATGINASSVTFSNTKSSLRIGSVEVTYVGPDPGTMVLSDAKTEATMEMPAYDATVDYELVRDMAVQMTTKVGDGADGADYRIRLKKKDGDKWEPADLTVAQVMGKFKVHDAIENKDLVFYGEGAVCAISIYAVDDQDQPTGNAIAFADLEPGRYVAIATAADGTAYDGQTPQSNVLVLFQGYEVTVPSKEFVTYYKDEPLYADPQTSADAELYTISSVSGNQATLSSAIETAPSNTPLLVYNAGNEDKTFLLIPTDQEPAAVSFYDGFTGTLTATTIAASTTDQTNFALNGKQFVYVKNAIAIGANKAYLSIQNSNARQISLVFDNEATGIQTSKFTKETNSEWYTIDGRKVTAPTKKGVYIQNGKKVVVK